MVKETERQINSSFLADWDNFVEKFLKIDGVFVMMLINKNAGSLTTHDIFQALWKIYAKEKANKEKVG